MKRKILFLIILFLIAIGAGGATQSIIEFTVQSSYAVLRSEGDEDSSTIDLTSEGDFANKPSDALEIVSVPSSTDAQGVKMGVIACAGSAADKTFTVTYYGYRAVNGPAQRIMAVDYTTGTQAVVKYPHNASTATSKYWADTATITNYRAAEPGRSDCDGNNGVAEIIWYTGGFKYVYAEVSSADGATGDEAGDVSIYYYLRP